MLIYVSSQCLPRVTHLLYFYGVMISRADHSKSSTVLAMLRRGKSMFAPLVDRVIVALADNSNLLMDQ
jgi:hypothetical protein